MSSMPWMDVPWTARNPRGAPRTERSNDVLTPRSFRSWHEGGPRWPRRPIPRSIQQVTGAATMRIDRLSQWAKPVRGQRRETPWRLAGIFQPLGRSSRRHSEWKKPPLLSLREARPFRATKQSPSSPTAEPSTPEHQFLSRMRGRRPQTAGRPRRREALRLRQTHASAG